VESDGIFIKIDQVRELRERVRFRPFEGRRRVVIMKEAHKLREEAANSLLKVLEEPPGQNVFILVTLEPQMLLPTVVSRCCHVRFQPLDRGIVSDYLQSAVGLDPARAEAVARLSGGSLDRARRLGEEGRAADWKRVIETLEALDNMPVFEMFSLTARYTASKEEQEEDGRGRKREELEEELECIKLWVRDIILFRLAGDSQPAFDLGDKTRAAAAAASVESLFALYREVEEAMSSLRLNAGLRLVIERVYLAVKDCLYGKGRWDSLSKRRQGIPL
jgi:DNA polymerase III subunit delta'